MSKTLNELKNEKDIKSNELMEIFDSVEEMSELSSDQKEEIKRRNLSVYRESNPHDSTGIIECLRDLLN